MSLMAAEVLEPPPTRSRRAWARRESNEKKKRPGKVSPNPLNDLECEFSGVVALRALCFIALLRSM